MNATLKSLAFITLVTVTGMNFAAFAQEASSGKKGSTSTAAQTSAASSATPETSAGKKAKSGPIKTSKITRGTVINLLTMKKISAADAGALANKSALALMVGTRIVYVLKSDGASAGDDLARLADAKVGVAGKTLTKGGATVILADIVDVIK